jgi:hypothetical protein
LNDMSSLSLLIFIFEYSMEKAAWGFIFVSFICHGHVRNVGYPLATNLETDEPLQ